MSVLRLPEPLDTVYTDADWAQDFELPDLNMVGDAFDMTFLGRAGSSDLARAGFTLTSATGALQLLAPDRVGVRMSGASGAPLRNLPAGDYDFVLRRFPLAGGVERLIEGRVTIALGYSLRVAGPVVAGGGATVQSQASAGRVRVLRTLSGPMGAPGSPGGLSGVIEVDGRDHTLVAASARALLAFTSVDTVQVDVPAGLPDLYTVVLAAVGGGPIYPRPAEGVELFAVGGKTGCASPGGALELLPLGGDRYLVRGGDVVPPGRTHPPTALTLAPDVVIAGAPPGTIIGQLLVDDVDPGDTFSFAMADDLDGRFAVDGSALIVGPAGLPGAGQQVLMPVVRVTDGDQYVLDDTVAVFVGLAGSLDFRRASQALPLTLLGFA